jgi:hypothetical protein
MNNNSKHIDEIGYRGAALAHGANYNARQDYAHNQNSNAMTKIDKSKIAILDSLSYAIKTNFPDFVFVFVEDDEDTHTSYTVKLKYDSIKYLTEQKVIIAGELVLYSKNKQFGTIEYQFNTQEFYRVSYSDKTSKSRRIHKLIPHNKKDIERILLFITNYMYSKDDYQHNVDVNGPASSKAHESMTYAEKK